MYEVDWWKLPVDKLDLKSFPSVGKSLDYLTSELWFVLLAVEFGQNFQAPGDEPLLSDNRTGVHSEGGGLASPKLLN